MGLFRLQRLAEVTSTNDVVKQALEQGVEEGLAVTAKRQSGGYGRQGRSWSSPEGGMYLSVLLRPAVPPAQLPTLSLVVAVAVRRALASLLTEEVAAGIKVKWPNDVCFVDDPRSLRDGRQAAFSAGMRKLSGISLEQHAGGVCVGIGVNVVPPVGGPEQVGGKNRPAYLEDLGLGIGCERAAAIEEVRAAVLRELEAAYGCWLEEGIDPFLAEYGAHAALTGLTVVVEDRQGAVLAAGQVAGVDAAGRLMVQPSSGGDPVAVASGEAHLRPLAG